MRGVCFSGVERVFWVVGLCCITLFWGCCDLLAGVGCEWVDGFKRLSCFFFPGKGVLAFSGVGDFGRAGSILLLA